MDLSKNVKMAIGIITLLTFLLGGLATVYNKFFVSPEKVDKIETEQVDIGIEVYDQKTRNLRRQDLEFDNMVRQEELREDGSSERVQKLKEAQQEIQEDLNKAKKTREYYEQRKLKKRSD